MSKSKTECANDDQRCAVLCIFFVIYSVYHTRSTSIVQLIAGDGLHAVQKYAVQKRVVRLLLALRFCEVMQSIELTKQTINLATGSVSLVIMM